MKTFVLTLAGLGAFLAMTWVQQPQIAITLAVLVGAAVLWLIVYIQRNPNVSRRAKRSSWWYLIMVGVCVLKILQVIGSRR